MLNKNLDAIALQGASYAPKRKHFYHEVHKEREDEKRCLTARPLLGGFAASREINKKLKIKKHKILAQSRGVADEETYHGGHREIFYIIVDC